LLIQLFTAAGIYEQGQGLNCEFVVTRDVLTNFVATCRKERPAIERLLEISLRKDIAAKATRQLSEFLRLVGLSLQKSGPRKQGDSKIYLYKIAADQLAKIQADVQRRQDPAAKAEWDALQEQRFPDDPEMEQLMESARARRQEAVSRAVEAMDSDDSDSEDFIDLDLAEAELDAKVEPYGRRYWACASTVWASELTWLFDDAGLLQELDRKFPISLNFLGIRKGCFRQHGRSRRTVFR
jgi:hypothetical protein